MNLSVEYKRQFGWRSWSEVMNQLPPLDGMTVLDLGCGVGDQAAELAARGARVIGLDADDELLATAQSRNTANAEFRNGDLSTLQNVPFVDGIWCSFAAAYVPELGSTLACWRKHLKPNGWLALTEVDHLLGHEPVEPGTRSLLASYAQDALETNRYDFHMGRKLGAHLERAGYAVSEVRTVADQELSFNGPASSDVLESWRCRLDRLRTLRDFCGARFESVRDDFLNALSRADHLSDTKVYCCFARL